jgi:hypothetical protein
MEKLGLLFGAISWAIFDNSNMATLARVEPFPSIEQVQFVWEPSSTALMEILFT